MRLDSPGCLLLPTVRIVFAYFVNELNCCKVVPCFRLFRAVQIFCNFIWTESGKYT